MPDDRFHVYDTTLRDGTQQEGLALTVADKLIIARHLDQLGVGFVEGGWPGAVPKDTEFFRRALAELDLKDAQLAAFGATRRPVAPPPTIRVGPPCARRARQSSRSSPRAMIGTSCVRCGRLSARTSR